MANFFFALLSSQFTDNFFVESLVESISMFKSGDPYLSQALVRQILKEGKKPIVNQRCSIDTQPQVNKISSLTIYFNIGNR